MARRWIPIAAALALAACGDEPSAVREDPTTVGSSTAENPPRETNRQQQTTPAEVLTDGPRRDVARTIGGLVQAVELGDGDAFCAAVGRSPGGAQGVEALRACGRRAGIDPPGLPAPDELSVRSVEVAGSRATAKLVTGETVELERRRGPWRVVSFRP